MTVLIVLAAIVVYLIVCLVKPTHPCRRCQGYGTRSSRYLKSCRRSHGTAQRIRFGARVFHRGVTQSVRHRDDIRPAWDRTKRGWDDLSN